jgi:hypothetical protein
VGDKDDPLILETPVTLIGRWASARALDELELTERLEAAIKQTGGFTVGRGQVVFHVLGVAAQEWWPAGEDDKATEVATSFLDCFGDQRFTYMELDAVLEHARGGRDELPSEISLARRLLISILMFVFACWQQGLGPDVVNGLVRRGERAASAAGFTGQTESELALGGEMPEPNSR